MKDIVTSNIFEAVFLLHRAPDSYCRLEERTTKAKDGRQHKILSYVFKPTSEATTARDVFQDKKRAASEEGNIPIGIVHRLRHELVRRAKNSCSNTEL